MSIENQLLREALERVQQILRTTPYHVDKDELFSVVDGALAPPAEGGTLREAAGTAVHQLRKMEPDDSEAGVTKPGPIGEVAAALSLADEYRPTMRLDVVHAWSVDAVALLRSQAARIAELENSGN